MMQTRLQMQSFRKMMADERLVQAGAWITGHFFAHPEQPITTPLKRCGTPNPLTDVPFPDWPFDVDGTAAEAALEQFVPPGLLQKAGPGTYQQAEWGRFVIPHLPLFHVLNMERLETRFPQLRATIQGKRVLDAGCGMAPYSIWLDGLGAGDIIGIDFLKRHLDVAKRLTAALSAANVRLILGSIEEIPLPDASVDFVFCRGVVSLAHKQRTMREFARVLVPGGEGLLMLHQPAFYWRLVKLLAPSKRRLRRVMVGTMGLLGGAAFEMLGLEIKWRVRSEFRLAYERRKSFTRLANACGFEVESWEEGIPKPFVWIRKKR